MKTLEQLNCVELPLIELQQINGGMETSKKGFWQDIASFTGAVVNGFVALGTEGGRNAGISIK
jgi:hypothetical protein